MAGAAADRARGAPLTLDHITNRQAVSAMRQPVPEDLRMAVWLRRRRRTRYLRADSEPVTKSGGGKQAAAAFQRQILDQMERLRWYPMTGPVALDLHLKAERPNPPTHLPCRLTRWGQRFPATSAGAAATCSTGTTARSSFSTST